MSIIKIAKTLNCQLLKKPTCFDHWVSCGSEGRPLIWRSAVWFLDPCSLRVAVSLGKRLNSKLHLVSLLSACECVCVCVDGHRSRWTWGVAASACCVWMCVNADFEWSDSINTVHLRSSRLVFIRAPDSNEQHNFISCQVTESAGIKIIKK